MSQDYEMSNEDAVSLRDKLNAWAATLTEGESVILGQLLARASQQDDNDTSGYFWWFFQPQAPLISKGGAGLISNNPNSLIGVGVGSFRG